MNSRSKHKTVSIEMPNSVSLFYKKIIVDIPNSLHKEMKIQTTKEGIKLNALAIRIFEEYLNKVSKD